MLLRTHYAITLFFVLVFLSSVENKLVFVLVAMIATVLPDVDARFSTLGRKRIARILQFFTKHRGIIHSFTFLCLIILIMILFWPIVAFGFFLGYSLHLLADSFTHDGITPFYPWRKKTRWNIVTGGKIEVGILSIFIILDVILILVKLISVF